MVTGKRVAIFGLTLTFLTGILVAAAAAGRGMHHGLGHRMMGYGGWGYAWNQPWGTLDPEQMEKLDKLRRKYWEDSVSYRQEIFSKRRELWRLYSQESPEWEAIGKVEREIFDLSQKLREKHFAFRQETRNVAPQLWSNYGPWGCRHLMGPGWGRHHMGSGWGYPGRRHHHMGSYRGGKMMGPYGGGPCWRH